MAGGLCELYINVIFVFLVVVSVDSFAGKYLSLFLVC